MANFSLRRLRTILDFRKQLWFDPDAPVCDALGVGLCLTDQRLQPFLQVGRGSFVEAVVDLARVDQIVALAPAHIDAVPLSLVEREPGNGQRLALHAGLLHPVVRAPLRVGAIAYLRNDAFETE